MADWFDPQHACGRIVDVAQLRRASIDTRRMANDSAIGKEGHLHSDLSKKLGWRDIFKRTHLPTNYQASKCSNDLTRLAHGQTGLTITLVAVIYAAQPAP
jgi:hypothetical protein